MLRIKYIKNQYDLDSIGLKKDEFNWLYALNNISYDIDWLIMTYLKQTRNY